MPSLNGALYLLPWFPSRVRWDRVDEICTAFVQLVQGVLQNRSVVLGAVRWQEYLPPSQNSPLYYLDVQHWGMRDSCNFFQFVYIGMEREGNFFFKETKMHRAMFISFDIFTYTHTGDTSTLHFFVTEPHVT